MSAHPMIPGRLYWVKTATWEGPVLAAHGCDALAHVTPDGALA